MMRTQSFTKRAPRAKAVEDAEGDECVTITCCSESAGKPASPCSQISKPSCSSSRDTRRMPIAFIKRNKVNMVTNAQTQMITVEPDLNHDELAT